MFKSIKKSVAKMAQVRFCILFIAIILMCSYRLKCCLILCAAVAVLLLIGLAALFVALFGSAHRTTQSTGASILYELTDVALFVSEAHRSVIVSIVISLP